MEELDAKKMLELRLLDYLIKNNWHRTIEKFIKESETIPKTLAIDDGSLSDWFRSQASQAFSSKESLESYLQDVLPPIPDFMNLFQNGFPSIMPRQEQKMSKDLLAARMHQLAITTDDNTGTGLKISGEQYEMESTYNGSSTMFGSTCSELTSSNCASSYRDSGIEERRIEEQHEKLI